MTSVEQDPSTKKAILITRIVGWGSIAFALFTVGLFFYVGFFS